MAEESSEFTYDVFLSFRGEDTRYTFVGYLLEHLQRRGIKTFIDDQMLKAGHVISPALSKAIHESKVSIIVFSENYASSTWCLAELDEILNCATRNNNNKQLAFPIFYRVDPSDVRHQRNSYSEHIAAHEKRFGENSEKIRAWRSALREAANLKGHHISTGYEINHIEKIVEEVHANIAPKPLLGEDPVGLEQRTEEVRSRLQMKPNDDIVLMLGIYGIGGIGKTELAKSLYNKIVHQFEAASFLTNVREKSKKINGLEGLQKKLLSEMLEVLETKLGSTSRGIYEIKSRLGRKKVLLVLDDVDDREQMNNLAGCSDWFGLGSRIIITTRDKDLLIGHKVEQIYNMKELDYQPSLELFCQKAFRKSHPETGYEELSYRAVGYAKGLPLALIIIGSDLASENSLKAWEDALEEYESYPDTRIQYVLQRSYDKLQYNAKQVFLDIACFFKGERIEYVEMILKEFKAPRNIKVLVNKSILTMEDGCLNMHDLIQDMGREIVRREAPKIPGKRTRLWSHKDVVEVLAEDSGSDAIEGIMLDPPQREEVEWSGTAFVKMKHLRILIVQNTSFSTEPGHLPNYLRLLDWKEYPSRSFPPKFHPKDIIVFNLCKSYLTLEKPFKTYSCLTNMNFSHNQSITAMPSVSEVPYLREIRLDNCKDLIKVHESVGFLQNLAHLSASGCAKLSDFPRSMYLPSLEVLDLNLCIRLEHFPDIVNNMNQPLKIYMINTAIEELPDSIGKLTGLVCIEMSGSRKLRYLPCSLFMLPNVVTFKFGRCSSNIGESFRKFAKDNATTNGRSTLKTLHLEYGGLSDEDLHAILKSFPELQELIALGNNFVSLPECIKESVHLTSLNVSYCRELEKIPKCTSVRILNVDHCVELKEISEFPSTIQKLDARYTCSLTTKTLDMLWSQVKREIRGLEVVMHRTKIPSLLDWRGIGGNPRFWARRKFPIVALALAFSNVKGTTRKSRRQLVELHLVINGQCVPRKGYHNFRTESDHVLVCDLRLLFSEEEWLGLDAFLEHDWNLVQVSYEAPPTMTLSSWGVFVYKQETNMQDVAFMCPGPEYSDIAIISPRKFPSRDSEQERRKMVEEHDPDAVLNAMIKEMDFEKLQDYEDKDYAVERIHDLMKRAMEISGQAKDLLEGKVLNKNSSLSRYLSITKMLEDEKAAREEAPIPISTHQGSSELQIQRSCPRLQEVMEIFWCGMRSGLAEAQKRFPTLDIDTTMIAAYNKGKRYTLSQIPEFEVLATPKMKTYLEGIINALEEAKLSFPTLHVREIICFVIILGPQKEMKSLMGEGEASSCVHQGSSEVQIQSNNPQQEETTMEIFQLGMRHGLVEAQKSFPTLDIDTTMTAIYNKGKRYKLLPRPEFDVENLEKLEGIPEMKMYIEGIINALQEAKLSFPTLDVQAIQSVVLSTAAHKEMKYFMEVGKASTSGHQRSSEVQIHRNNPQQQEMMMEIFWNGMRDGLVEAQNMFPTLDIDTTMMAAYRKGKRHELIRFPGSVRATAEMKIYIEGIINALEVAKRSFPTLDIHAILDGVLNKVPQIEKKSLMEVGEASSSGHQGSSGVQIEENNLEQQEIIMVIFWNGLRDGLVEAQNMFPTLDIDTTMIAAYTRFEGTLVQESEVTNPEPEIKIYREGIISGLEEGKLSFPALDVEAILSVVFPLSKEAHKGTVEAPPPTVPTEVVAPSSDDPLFQALMMMESEAECKVHWKLMEEHRALRKKFEELENETAAAPDQYHELMEKLNTAHQSAAEFNISKKHHHEKLNAVLKGRAEELQGLYDAGIEGFQNSQEFQDLMSAIYLNGLKDGLLEAQATLLALDMDTITAPEEHVTDDDEAHNHIEERDDVTHEEAENPNEPILGTADNIPSSPDSAGDPCDPSGWGDFGRFFL